MDNEVKGEGLQYDYGFRVYDPRLGKFLSTDPLFKGFPYYTPYQFAGNSPIMSIDLDGLEELPVTKSKWVRRNRVFLLNGQELDGDVDILIQSSKKSIKVTVGESVITPGYEGSDAFYETRIYKQLPRPSLRGIRRFKEIRRIDSVVKGTAPMPVIPDPVPESPQDNTETKLQVIGAQEIPLRTNRPISNDLPATIDSNSINQVNKPEPEKVIEPITLDIQFTRRTPDFPNEMRAKRKLRSLVNKLNANPENRLKITVNVQVTEGPEAVIEYNWFSPNYLASQLGDDRKASITKLLKELGASSDQFEFTSTTFNGSQTHELNAELTTVKE